jgi:hypothetical protein
MRGGMFPLIPKLGNTVYGDYWSVLRFWLGDWRYSSTISDLSTRWWRVISLFLCRFNYRRKIPRYQKDGVGWATVPTYIQWSKEKRLRLPGIETCPFSL